MQINLPKVLLRGEFFSQRKDAGTNWSEQDGDGGFASKNDDARQTGPRSADLLGSAPFEPAAKPCAASAADLGGDCCADLEQRVAELEATTVRKSGRVSVTISGYTAKQVFSWDDGVESNTYVSDIGPTRSQTFQNWWAGADRAGLDCGLPVPHPGAPRPRRRPPARSTTTTISASTRYWFLVSEDYGKATLGKQALASKSVAMFTDLSARS